MNPDDNGLRRLGWSPFFAAALPAPPSPSCPARVVAELGPRWVVDTGSATLTASLSGGLRQAASHPVVGDWVLLGDGDVIIELFERRGALVRKVAGEVTRGQVMAANVDLVLIVASLSLGARPRGLERYLTMAWDSGAEPLVVLTKTDLVDEVDAALALVAEVTAGVEVHPLSALTGAGLDGLTARLTEGLTAVVVGPSGAGKSTLINRLLGRDAIKTAEVREDQRGRHTTTNRELYHLPGGAMIIDTPGIRELQLWQSEDGFNRAFSDVGELALRCRFSDCAHGGEPGCAVTEAVTDGSLSAARLDGYRKLERELAQLAKRADGHARAEAHRQVRVFGRAVKQVTARKQSERGG